MSRHARNFLRCVLASATDSGFRIRRGALAALLAASVSGCGGPGGAKSRDETSRFASLDSAASAGRILLWRAHACVQRTFAAQHDTVYPSTDSSLRTDPDCAALPFGASRSSDGWQLAYRRTGDTSGYELRADRHSRTARAISLYSRVIAHEVNSDAGIIHAREGDSLATWSDPVIGSPLPALVWLAWCLEMHQTTRDTGVEGYLVHIRPLAEGDIRCVTTPPFSFGADSDEAVLSQNGMEYIVRYEPGPLEGESLSEPGREGEMEPILEWQVNSRFALRATPRRYGYTGLRSYFIEQDGGVANAWITQEPPKSTNSLAYTRLEAPMCDWLRGARCVAPHPSPNDGSFGPGLLTIFHPETYKAH